MSANAHIPYTILSQDFAEELTPNGSFVDTWRITFQGPSGDISNVKVPAQQYSAATVDAAIQQSLLQIESVRLLGAVPASDLGLT